MYKILDVVKKENGHHIDYYLVIDDKGVKHKVKKEFLIDLIDKNLVVNGKVYKNNNTFSIYITNEKTSKKSNNDLESQKKNIKVDLSNNTDYYMAFKSSDNKYYLINLISREITLVKKKEVYDLACKQGVLGVALKKDGTVVETDVMVISRGDFINKNYIIYYGYKEETYSFPFSISGYPKKDLNVFGDLKTDCSACLLYVEGNKVISICPLLCETLKNIKDTYLCDDNRNTLRFRTTHSMTDKKYLYEIYNATRDWRYGGYEEPEWFEISDGSWRKTDSRLFLEGVKKEISRKKLNIKVSFDMYYEIGIKDDTFVYSKWFYDIESHCMKSISRYYYNDEYYREFYDDNILLGGKSEKQTKPLSYYDFMITNPIWFFWSKSTNNITYYSLKSSETVVQDLYSKDKGQIEKEKIEKEKINKEKDISQSKPSGPLSTEEFIICENQLGKMYKIGVKSHTYTPTTDKEIKALKKVNRLFIKNTVSVFENTYHNLLFMSGVSGCYLYKDGEDITYNNENYSLHVEDDRFEWLYDDDFDYNSHNSEWLYVFKREKNDTLSLGLPFLYVEVPRYKTWGSYHSFDRYGRSYIKYKEYSHEDKPCLELGTVLDTLTYLAYRVYMNKSNFYYYYYGRNVYLKDNPSGELLKKVSIASVKKEIDKSGGWFVK